MRRTLIGGLLIGLGMLAWYLDGLLYHSAWVNHYGPGMDPEIIRGWRILLAAWPLTIVGVVAGGTIALSAFCLIYSVAEESDRGREVKTLRATLATLKADVQLEIAERERVALDMIERAHNLIRQADERERSATNLIDAACRERDRAVEAASRTRHAYDRKCRQLEKAQSDC